ncbi:MAG: hypothetical protein AAGF04_04675 [Chlamydiota bacterium]
MYNTFVRCREKLSYFLIRSFIYPIGFLPLPWIRRLGKALGCLLYYTVPKYRKRTLSNLSLASSLNLRGKELRKIAIHSLQNFAIVALEYPKFARLRNLGGCITCRNPKKALALIEQGIGIVFFCGHQANWETLFLDGTTRMPGTAIGKATKNRFLYAWIIAIRERYGGKMIEQKRALKEGLRALKKGHFLGILGDQADPESSFSFPFFGRRSKTSLAPALLSYKSGCPLIVATTKRTQKGYEIEYADPIWPDTNNPLRKEAPWMMEKALYALECSIAKAPGEWLWTHNKYKQHNKRQIRPRFRHDALLFIFDLEHQHLLPQLQVFRRIYPDSFFFLCLHEKSALPPPDLDIEELLFFRKEEDLWIDDHRCKCVFNFSRHPSVKRHFLKKSAHEVLSYPDLYQLAKDRTSPSAILQSALLKSFP